MSLRFKDIDEYTDQELLAEIALRHKRRQAGLCDYCNRGYTEAACKFPERHQMIRLPGRCIGFCSAETGGPRCKECNYEPPKSKRRRKAGAET